MRVGFFISPTKEWLGGVNYFKNLFEALETARPPSYRLYVFVPMNVEDDVLSMLQINTGSIKLIKTKMLQFRHPYWIFWKLTRKLLKSDFAVSVLASKYKLNVISHSGLVRVPGVRIANWIPDFQHIHLPKMFSKAEVVRRNKQYSLLVSQADKVFVSSNDAKKDLVSILPKFESKVSVLKFVSSISDLYWVLDDAKKLEILRRYNLAETYFYVPNQFWRHKNHMVLIEAVRLLAEIGLSFKIVCSGAQYDYRDPGYYSEFKSALVASGCERYFDILGVIPYSDVFALIKFSAAVINPSLFEGWSSAVEECKYVSKRMILSRIDVHLEQYPQAEFFDPDDANSLALKMNKLINQPELEVDIDGLIKINNVRKNQYGLDFFGAIKDLS